MIGSALLMGALPAVASAACNPGTESETFAQFGDSASYVLAPGGSFESGAPGWSLNRAGVVAGNERFNLVPGSQSLGIDAGGSAASPRICVSSKYPSFRFVARQLSGGSTRSSTSACVGSTCSGPRSALRPAPSARVANGNRAR